MQAAIMTGSDATPDNDQGRSSNLERPDGRLASGTYDGEVGSGIVPADRETGEIGNSRVELVQAIQQPNLLLPL
jgi:hypothetical protein